MHRRQGGRPLLGRRAKQAQAGLFGGLVVEHVSALARVMTVLAAFLAVATATLSWLLFVAVWAIALLVIGSSRRRSPFKRRLDRLLVLLQVDGNGRGTIGTLKGTVRGLARQVASGGLRWSARRWQAKLGAIYAQGYQVASETISSPVGAARGGELVRETVQALKAERAGVGAIVQNTEDPVVVLAYGLGAWPAGADMRSLEELLAELGMSHGALRSRFESLVRTVAPANQNREFRELAGASFVLGASARIIEAAAPPGSSVAPPRWVGALKAYQRRRSP
jgi:hypothetical protein